MSAVGNGETAQTNLTLTFSSNFSDVGGTNSSVIPAHSNDSTLTTDQSRNDESFVSDFLAPPYLFIYLAVIVLGLILVTVVIVFCVLRIWRKKKFEKTLKEKFLNRVITKKKLGLVEYILNYDYMGGRVNIEILQIHDIKFLGKSHQPDVKEISTYFRIFLVPNMNHYKESNMVSKTFSPHFGESFTFKCLIDDLDSSKILVRLFQHHKCLRDMPIGDALIQLSKSDLKIGFATEPMYSYNPALDDPLGEICVSLRYNPARSKLTITIIECRRLKPMDWNGKADPYVKIIVLYKEKVIFKEKTQVKKETINPYYNTTFSVKIAPSKIQSVDMRIIVKDYDLFGSNETVGGVRFGIAPDSEVAERQWNNMVENLKRPQTEWHHLLSIE